MPISSGQLCQNPISNQTTKTFALSTVPRTQQTSRQDSSLQQKSIACNKKMSLSRPQLNGQSLSYSPTRKTARSYLPSTTVSSKRQQLATPTLYVAQTNALTRNGRRWYNRGQTPIRATGGLISMSATVTKPPLQGTTDCISLSVCLSG